MEDLAERKYRYDLKDTACELYRRFRVVDRVRGLMNCCEKVPMGSQMVMMDGWGRIYIGGMNHCRSRSSCPICSLKIQKTSLDQIRQGILNARRKHMGVYLVTYNLRHVRTDELSVLLAGYQLAKETMYRNGSFWRLVRSIGYVGRITDFEVQLCGLNGCHPHSHDLWFFMGDIDMNMLRDDLATYWVDSLEKVGLSAKKDVAVDVLGYYGVGDYVTKLSAEMTLHLFTKESFSEYSLSPFRCLSAYRETGEEFYGVNWIDYVLNIKRKRILGWSRGLKDLLEVVPSLEDSEDDGFECFLSLPDPSDRSKLTGAEWMDVRRRLEIGDLDSVLDDFKRVSISYSINENLLYQYENRTKL